MQIAIRTVHYLAYHVAMGMSGLLLYTDAVQRHYLRKQLVLQPYLRAGHLRCVAVAHRCIAASLSA